VSRSPRPPMRKWLAPLVPLYRLAVGARALSLRIGFQPVHRLRSPVISIGSLSAGGAGKTPLVISLARALTQGSTHAGTNRTPCCTNIDVLSRGYGRRSQEPARVDPNGTAGEFGDEPILIAHATGLPVYVAAQRYQAGLLAEREAESRSASDSAPASDREKPRTSLDPGFIGVPEGRSLPQGVIVSRGAQNPNWAQPAAREPQSLAVHLPQIHLLDDGFQHRQLHRDIDIVLLSRHDRDDRLLPSGNLREPFSALRRATILAVPADESELASELYWQGPVWLLHRRMEIPQIAGPVLAFCGIARPEQFFSGLTAAGVSLAARIAFPDHHRYTPADLARLLSAAQSVGASALLTTEKDRMRLGPLGAQLAQKLPLETARLQVEIDKEETAVAGLLDALRSHQA
jgi:tetraacyldisaccharide 4'-kinase